jgi:hypothetical protein
VVKMTRENARLRVKGTQALTARRSRAVASLRDARDFALWPADTAAPSADGVSLDYFPTAGCSRASETSHHRDFTAPHSAGLWPALAFDRKRRPPRRRRHASTGARPIPARGSLRSSFAERGDAALSCFFLKCVYRMTSQSEPRTGVGRAARCYPPCAFALSRLFTPARSPEKAGSGESSALTRSKGVKSGPDLPG